MLLLELWPIARWKFSNRHEFLRSSICLKRPASSGFLIQSFTNKIDQQCFPVICTKSSLPLNFFRTSSAEIYHLALLGLTTGQEHIA